MLWYICVIFTIPSNDPDNYAAFIESFDISTVSLTMWGPASGSDVLPLVCHAYYGLDMSRDILKRKVGGV